MSKSEKFTIMKLPAGKPGKSAKLAGMIIGGGLLVGGGLIAGGRAIGKKIAQRINRKKQEYDEEDLFTKIDIYTVETDGQSREGLVFNAGEQFRVLEVHGDAAVIEKFEDSSSPYLVSAEYLSTISNYEPVVEEDSE